MAHVDEQDVVIQKIREMEANPGTEITCSSGFHFFELHLPSLLSGANGVLLTIGFLYALYRYHPRHHLHGSPTLMSSCTTCSQPAHGPAASMGVFSLSMGQLQVTQSLPFGLNLSSLEFIDELQRRQRNHAPREGRVAQPADLLPPPGSNTPDTTSRIEELPISPLDGNITIR